MHGADMMYSEFIFWRINSWRNQEPNEIRYFDYERPVGIQIFGGDEEAMALSLKIVSTVNPDIIDINFDALSKK
jgi:tRNA-dihydrouridine synthase